MARWLGGPIERSPPSHRLASSVLPLPSPCFCSTVRGALILSPGRVTVPGFIHLALLLRLMPCSVHCSGSSVPIIYCYWWCFCFHQSLPNFRVDWSFEFVDKGHSFISRSPCYLFEFLDVLFACLVGTPSNPWRVSGSAKENRGETRGESEGKDQENSTGVSGRCIVLLYTTRGGYAYGAFLILTFGYRLFTN